MSEDGDGMRGRVVVVTGASAGVGRAVVRLLAKRGARIGLIARGRDGLEGARRDVESLGGEAVVLPLDVADASAVEGAAARVERELGPIDVWINNAMVSVFSPVKEMQADEYRRVTEVTYLGYVHGTLAALRRMLPRDRGVIVQVGSALAYRGIPLQSAYCGAKHAIQGFTDSLRTELLHDGSGVRVTEVHLAAMNTPQFGWVKSRLPNKAQPVPPIYQPEVAAEGVVFAAENDRRQVWVGFPTAKTIVGNRIAPWYADDYLAKHGVDSQQTDEPRDAGRPNNLWEPVPGDHGAHGDFDARARHSSWQLRASENRGALAAVGAGLVGLALAALLGGGDEGDEGNGADDGVELLDEEEALHRLEARVHDEPLDGEPHLHTVRPRWRATVDDYSHAEIDFDEEIRMLEERYAST